MAKEEMMERDLQVFCDERKHNLKKYEFGFKIFFYARKASQLDVQILLDFAQQYNWLFFITAKYNGTIYAQLYKPSY